MKHLILPLVAGFSLGSAAFAQSTWYVDASAAGPGTGTQADPFQRIDYALAASYVVDQDTLLVLPGDYPGEAMDFLGKDVVVRGTAGAQWTRVVGPGPGGSSVAPFVTMNQGESSLCRVEGLTFTGFETQFPSALSAIVLTGASSQFIHCVFEDNRVSTTGSIHKINLGSPLFEGCVWRSNTSDCAGGVESTGAQVSFYGCRWVESDIPLSLFGGTALFEDCDLVENQSFAGLCSGTGIGATLEARSTDLVLRRTSFRGGQINPGFFTFPHHVYLEDCTSSIEGCVWQGGYRLEGPGAGIFARGGNLLMQDSTFFGLTADRGGAIGLEDMSASIEDCAFFENQGDIEDFEGGAIYAANAGLAISRTRFEGNQAGLGGAVGSILGTVFVEDCDFVGNIATRGTYLDSQRVRGGALYSTGPTTVLGTRFENNLALSTYVEIPWDQAYGGALYLGPNSIVSQCYFEGNVVEAGQACEGGAAWLAFPGLVEHCVFLNNSAVESPTAVGGALAGSGDAIHCTLVGNTSSGTGSDVGVWDVLDSILVPGGPSPVAPGAQVSYSLVVGGWPGVGNLDEDPLFWGAGDVHLLPGSPAIDAGDPAGPVDPDGSRGDMGALPYDPNWCGPGCSSTSGITYCLSNPNSTGSAARTFVLGSELAAENHLVLAADQLPVGVLGYFLLSPEAGYVPLFGGSQGNLCLGSPQLRWNDTISRANGAGQIGRALDLANLPQGNFVVPGDLWHFQLWFRDMDGGMPVSNTSSGLRVSFH